MSVASAPRAFPDKPTDDAPSPWRCSECRRAVFNEVFLRRGGVDDVGEMSRATTCDIGGHAAAVTRGVSVKASMRIDAPLSTIQSPQIGLDDRHEERSHILVAGFHDSADPGNVTDEGEAHELGRYQRCA